MRGQQRNDRFMKRVMDNVTIRGTKANRLAMISSSRVATEGVQQAAVFGSLLLSRTMLDKPLDPVVNYVAKHIVEPNLQSFENSLNHLPSIRTSEDKERLDKLTPQERAKTYAKTLVDYSIAFGVGITAQTKGQELMDRVFQIPDLKAHDKHGYWKVTAVDRAVQLGSIVVLNTVGTKPSVAVQKGIQNVLQKAGFSESNADEAASYAVNWMAPNLAGMAAAIGTHHVASGKMKW